MHFSACRPELTHAAVLRLPAHCRPATLLHNRPMHRARHSDSERTDVRVNQDSSAQLFANRHTVPNVVAGKETDGYTL
jgi:hypothetical protein